MKSTIRYFSKLFFGDVQAIHMERRVFVTGSFLVFLGTFLGFVLNLIIGMPVVLNILVGAFMLVYFLLFFNARFRNKYSPKTLYSSLIFLTFLYFLNGGLGGSTPALYPLFVILFITILNSKYQLLIFVLTTLNFLGLIVAELFFLEHLVVPYASGEARKMDLAFGYTVILIISFILINYFKNNITSKSNQLRKLNQSKDFIFNTIAHDLKSPINNILGFSDLLLDSSEKTTKKEQLRYAQIINKQTRHTIELLESLLEWGRIQQTEFRLLPQIINLTQAINETIEFFNDNLSLKEINIEVHASSNINVYADKIALRTIIRNLLSNSLKFTPSKGKIIISTEEFNSNYLAIVIQDSGIGMEKDLLENLFNLEYKTNRLGLDGEASTGLGLVITKELAEKQGGKLFIESKQNQGSTFKFTVLKSSKS